MYMNGYGNELIPRDYVNPVLEEYRQQSLEARIAQLENQNMVQAQELIRQNNEIIRLNQEIKRLNDVNVAQSRRIERLNMRLKTVENLISVPVKLDDEGF